MASSTWDKISSILLVAVAFSMFGLYVYDRSHDTASSRPTNIDNWEGHNLSGVRLGGPEDARLVITEFMDFTCPYCRQLAPVTDSLVRAFPEQVTIVFQHFPLQGHEASFPSAIAAECAHEQGRFEEMYHALYENADSIGSWDWTQFGMVAEIPNIEVYEDCVDRPQDSFLRIANGRPIGEETGVRGTPTVWVNGEVVSARTVAEFKEIAQQQGIELIPIQ